MATACHAKFFYRLLSTLHLEITFFTKSEREILEPLATTGGHSKLVTRSRSQAGLDHRCHLSSQLGCSSFIYFFLLLCRFSLHIFDFSSARFEFLFDQRKEEREREREILLLVVSSRRKRLRIRNDKGKRIRRIEHAGSSNGPLKPIEFF